MTPRPVPPHTPGWGIDPRVTGFDRYLDEPRAGYHCAADAIDGRCSRCHEPIEDFRPPDGGMTAGYYVAAGWSEFTNPGEVYVCDTCMWKDPRYIAVYGDHLAPQV